MGQYGQPPSRRPLPRGVYWQRRVIVLILGCSVLGLLVLTVNSALSTGAAAGQAPGTAGAPRAGTSQPQAGRSAGAGGAGQAARTVPSSPGPGGRPACARRSAGAGQAGRTAPSSPGPGGRPACARRSVILSLFTSRYWYNRGQEPQFAVAVVSVARRPCRFDLGARAVSVVITWGRTRVWRSSDCVLGAASRAVTLTRGVPAVIHVTWDRRTSAPGCPGTGRPVRLGTYTATAYSGHLHSGTLVIVLAGPGVGAP